MCEAAPDLIRWPIPAAVSRTVRRVPRSTGNHLHTHEWSARCGPGVSLLTVDTTRIILQSSTHLIDCEGRRNWAPLATTRHQRLTAQNGEEAAARAASWSSVQSGPARSSSPDLKHKTLPEASSHRRPWGGSSRACRLAAVRPAANVEPDSPPITGRSGVRPQRLHAIAVTEPGRSDTASAHQIWLAAARRGSAPRKWISREREDDRNAKNPRRFCRLDRQ